MPIHAQSFLQDGRTLKELKARTISTCFTCSASIPIGRLLRWDVHTKKRYCLKCTSGLKRVRVSYEQTGSTATAANDCTTYKLDEFALHA